MTQITEGNYNRILASGRDLLIAMVDPDSPKTIIAMEKMRSIDQMIGKGFIVCKVDAIAEKAVESVLCPEELPAFYFIHNKRIHSVMTGLPDENEILSMTVVK